MTAEVTWDRNNALTWSDPLQSDPISTSSYVDRTIGSSSNIAAWGGHAWTRNDLLDANFAVRLTWNDGTAGCAVGRSVNLDQLNVRVSYSYDQTTTTTVIEPTDVESPLGDVLVPQGFWGALQSQGAPNIQGDAYMTYYDTRTSVVNDAYGPAAFYQYGIEFPAGSSGGEVWLFDPGFCHVDTDKGTGESYTLGGSNGSSSFNPVSTFYDLFDTRNTPYDQTDDTLIYSSGNAYRQTTWRDTLLDVSSPVTADPCDDLAWHNEWARIAQGLSGGRTYRLHTYSTDPNATSDQRQTTALNAFAIWSTASGGTPRVYGLGAMEAYVRLPGGQSTEFYLAQIDAEHAGKTLAIGLWDPGDTGALAANLQILQPTPSGYAVVPFNYTAAQNSGAAANCNSRSGTNVTSVTTNTGGTSLYNGCWVNIEIPLPVTYSAPLPSGDPFATEGGWWKIRYNMSGATTSFSTDLTTWEVAVRGNPVHLVVE